MADDTTTITITNFAGRLTRKLNGDMNSGYAKFATSFGYDPFSKPDNLTWFEQPVNIATTGASSVNALMLSAIPHFEVNTTYFYAVDSAAMLYKIQPNSIANPNLDNPSIIGSIVGDVGAARFNYGASMELFGNSSLICVSSDNNIFRVNTDGSGNQTLKVSVVSSRYHPLQQFIGKLIIGNGNNLQAMDNTFTQQTSLASSGTNEGYGIISPPLPIGTVATDIDTSMDGNYLLITGSNILMEDILTVSSDRQNAAGGQGTLFRWNGVDQAITSETFISSNQLTALQTYLGNQMLFANDALGGSMNDGTNKILTLANNKAPLPNATAVNGNFITWVNPEVVGSSILGSMYYFGQLDQENQPGLWRVMRQTASLASGYVYQTPLNVLVNNNYQTVNNTVNSVATLGYGKHYFSLFEINASNTTVGANTTKFFRFLVTSSGTGTPQQGVYETQTQLFSKRVQTKEVRVYTEPTASGNGFQLDLIGADGTVLTNGTGTYTFSAGTDPTQRQGSLQMIPFKIACTPTFALGVRLTNTGTTNMTIKKVEIDTTPAR